MKKKLGTFLILSTAMGSSVVHAQSAVTIYGIVDATFNYTNKVKISGTNNTGSKLSVDSGNNTGSRIGFKGTEDLGNGLRAVFQLESGFKNDNGALDGSNNGVANTNTLFRRLSVVGLSGDFGTVLVGRQTDPVYQYNRWTSAGDFGGFTGFAGHNLDRLEGTRTNNSIRFNSADYNGFTASVIYGFGEVAGNTSAGQAFGVGGQYLNGPLALFAAYYQSKLGADATGVSSDTTTLVAGNGKAGDVALKVANLGVSYQAGATRLYANWSQAKQPLATTSTISPSGVLPSGFTIGGENNNKANIYEVGFYYEINPQWAFLGSLEHSRLSYAGNGTLTGKLTQLSVGPHYFFSKRTDVFAYLGYLHAVDTQNPGVEGAAAGQNANQTVVALGIRHRF